MSHRLQLLVVLGGIVTLTAGFAADTVSTPPIIQGGNGVRKIAVDASGNRYCTGFFNASVDFNPFVGADVKTNIGIDTYVTKFNSDGSYAWTQIITGSGTETPSQLALNAAGTVLYVVGGSNSADLGIGTIGTVAISGQDGFIAALITSTGAADTSFSGDGLQLFGGSSGDNAQDIVISGSTIFVAGTFSSVNASLGGSGSFSAGTGSDDYVVAIDTSGNLVTSFNGTGLVQFGSPTTSIGSAVLALSGSTLYLGGGLSNASDYGVGGSGSVSGNGTQEVYVLALNAATGAVVSGFGSSGVVRFGGSGQDGILDLQAANGFVYGAGFMDSTDAGFNGTGTISRIGASFSSFVFCLDGATGAAVNAFDGNGVQLFGGSSGSSQCNSIALVGNNLYLGGDFTYPDGGIGVPGTAAAASNDAYVVALNATTGAALTAFSADGIVKFGGTSGESTECLAVAGNAVFASGSSSSTDNQFEGAGGTSDATGFSAFFLVLDQTTGAQTTFMPGAAATVVASPNPARSGGTVTFTATGTAPFNWDFGDGSSGSGNPIAHTYTVSTDTNFTVTLSGGASATLSLPVLAANANAAGVPNIGDGKTVANPLTTLSITVAASNGGVVELSINDTTVPRAIGEITTDFGDIPGRQSSVNGPRAVHKFVQPGVFIATAHANDGGVEKAKMRKTLALSSRETGASDALAKPSSTDIAAFRLKGKFLFTKDTPDAVTFSGEIVLPPGFNPKRADGNVLSIGIGNVVDTVTVDAKGKGGASTSVVVKKISVKYPRLAKTATATVGGEKAKVSAQLSVANLDAAGFDTEGITNTLRADEAGQKSVKRSIQIAIVIGGVSYETIAPVDYKLSRKADAGQIAGRASVR